MGISKKLIYLNVMYCIVFFTGVGLAIAGFFHPSHTIVVESFGVPMVSGSLSYGGYESHHFLKQYSKHKKD